MNWGPYRGSQLLGVRVQVKLFPRKGDKMMAGEEDEHHLKFRGKLKLGATGEGRVGPPVALLLPSLAWSKALLIDEILCSH